jgi:Protein of unknown function (Hypoth_ymh)
MAKRLIEGCYARLKGMQEAIPSDIDILSLSFADDYKSVLASLRSLKIDDFAGFDLSEDAFRNHSDPRYKIEKLPFRLKISQLLRYLEQVHQTSEKIIEIGSIYNSISDAELKSRCGDLLSAPDHFDRVINQATQVLEERIRAKVPSLQGEIGTNLVNKAVKNEPGISPIKFSDVAAEQEGFAALLRGVVGAFRNPSHHRFLNEVTREQALQICAFIDNMLNALEKAEVKRS